MVDEEEGSTRLTRSFSARMRRKEQVARGEVVPDMPEDSLSPGAGAQTEEPDEEAALSDEELLAKYGVDDPEVIEDEDKLDNLLQGQFPDRIRQMALRRMWRLNPLFRFADEMVEYGENYTDAATAIEGMQTAYQVGKGYLQQAFDAVDDKAGDVTAAGSEAKSLADKEKESLTAKDPAQPDENDVAAENAAEDGDEDSDSADRQLADMTADHLPNNATADATALENTTGEAGLGDESGPTDSESDAVPPPPRPRRMSFRRPVE